MNAAENQRPAEPRALGRFNYISYAPNIYSVIFIPFGGTSCMLIAKNLPKEECIELMDILNSEVKTSIERATGFINNNTE